MMRLWWLCVLFVGGFEPSASLLALSPRAANLAVVRPVLPCHAVRWRTPLSLADDDEINGYRELGVSEDASYDNIMDAFMALTETADPDRQRRLEIAKNKVLDDRLKLRMTGGSVSAAKGPTESPWDDRPKVRKPLGTIAKEKLSWLRKPFLRPTLWHIKKTVPLLGGMTVMCLLAPRSSTFGRGLMFIITGQLLYQRDGVEAPVDDFGQVGEIKPMKKKPALLALGIMIITYLSAIKTSMSLAGALGGWGVVEKSLRMLLIGVFYIVVVNCFKVQNVFVNEDF